MQAARRRGYCWVDIVVAGKVSPTTILPLSYKLHSFLDGRGGIPEHFQLGPAWPTLPARARARPEPSPLMDLTGRV
jgi:hypothetical protein